MTKKTLIILIVVALALAIFALKSASKGVETPVKQAETKKEITKNVENAQENSANSKQVKEPMEVKIEVTKEGTGDRTVKNGDIISVHYTGKLENGTKFDSSVDSGEPVEFTIGQGMVIQGWEQGLLGMKVGEKRTLTIPSELGYGSRGAGGVIPPNATLIFDVELMGIK